MPIRSLAAAATTLVLLGCASSAFAFNRCTDAKGKVTYQDAPCDTSQPHKAGPTQGSASPSTNTSGGSGDYSIARGAWRGPAQFQLVVGSERDLEAQRVVPMVIELQADGKVQGVIPEAGCSLSGLATQFVTPASASVDVTLKGCTDSRFNARMSGHLVANSGAKEAKLNLNAFVTPTPLRKMQQMSVEAVLRR